MDEHDLLAERFDTQRARLRAIAYRTLGSASDADDAVQETWLRLSRTDPGSIDNLGGWLTTVVARVCLNMLQSRREEPVADAARDRARAVEVLGFNVEDLDMPNRFDAASGRAKAKAGAPVSRSG